MHRPENTTPTTLAEVLTLPALQNVTPEILVGADRLDTPVSWVHVVDSPRAGELLSGGELALTTGAGWGESPADWQRMIRSLARSRAAALLIELRTTWQETPAVIRRECEALDLPLIVVHAELRFVAITQQIHSRILDDHLLRIDTMRDIAETFTTLIVNGAPTEQLLLHTARLLELPVVLEDGLHRVVHYSAVHELPSLLLEGWSARSRRWSTTLGELGSLMEPTSFHEQSNAGRSSWTCVDIQARGTVWGRLFCQGRSPNPAGTQYIIRQAALALAVERLGCTQPYSWNDLMNRNALQTLVGTRYTTVSCAQEVLTASGFRTRGRQLHALALNTTDAALPAGQIRQALEKLGVDVLAAPSPDNPRVLLATVSSPPDTQIRPLLQRALENLRAPMAVLLSRMSTSPVSLAQAVRQLQRGTPPTPPRDGVRILALGDAPVAELLHVLHDDVRVQGYVEQVLGPLLDHDSRHGTDLLVTLRAVLSEPGSRTAAAQQLHLSRTSLYSRIATLERLLGVALTDGEDHFALSLALRAHDAVMRTHRT